MESLRTLLKAVVESDQTLSREQARTVLRDVLTPVTEGAATEPQIAALLTAIATRGETAAELTGFAEAMRAAATPLPLTDEERGRLVDTCGTGGDGHGTFNISTGAALVAAAAGARVAKHGNRAVTSKCGSADVLEALGVPVDLGPERAAECLRETGFLFMLAPVWQPAMRRVGPVRRALGFRTIFNLAGPLTNPAGAQAQVMGVWAESKIDLVAESMRLLGVRHAFVVHGETGEGTGGLDELTVTGVNHVGEIRRPDSLSATLITHDPDGLGKALEQPILASEVRRFTLQPEELGLARASLGSLGGGGSAEESAAVLRAIFAGDERGARRDVVLLNAAAALVAGGVAVDWREGLERARAAIDSGTVEKLLAGLRAFAGSASAS